MAQVTVVVHRKEGGPLEHRISEEKLNINLIGDWLVLNEKTGEYETMQTPQGPMKNERLRTFEVVPGWNVLNVEVKRGGGFTTA